MFLTTGRLRDYGKTTGDGIDTVDLVEIVTRSLPVVKNINAQPP